MARSATRIRRLRWYPVAVLFAVCVAAVAAALLLTRLPPPPRLGEPTGASAAEDPSHGSYVHEPVAWSGVEGAGAAEEEPARVDVHECSTLTAEVGAVPGTEAVATPLRSGVPHHGVVADGEYRRYEMCILSQHGHDHDVRLTLTAVRGDPDLYASTSEPGLALDSADWIAASPGGDALRLSTALPDWGTGRRSLFVAVYGRTDAEYTLVAEVTTRTRPPSATRPQRLRGPRRKRRRRS